MDLATAAKRRKRKKKKARCTPAKRKHHKKAKSSSLDAAAARKKHRRKKRPVCKKKKRHPKPSSGTHPKVTKPATPPAPGPAAPVPPPPPPPKLSVITSPIAVYDGPFGFAQAERLLWRAGFGPRPGQAAALAALGLEKAVLSLTRPSGAAPMDGPAPTDDGDAARALRPLRPRPPVLARPHGPLAPPARRAARARLPRLVRDLQRRGRLGAVHARPDQPVPRPRPRQLQEHGAGDHAGPGDDPVPRPRLEPQGRDQRELRARADGAVHARRRPRGLHRERRARARALAQRLGLRLERRSSASTTSAGTSRTAGTRATRPCSARPGAGRGRTPRAWSSSTRSTRRSSSRSCGATSSRPRPTPARPAKLEQLYVSSGYAIRPVLEAILCSPQLYDGPADGQAADGVRGRDAARPQARDHRRTRGTGCSPAAGQRPLLPARRLGLGRQALARHQHHARALGGGRDGARGRHRRSERDDYPAGDARTRRSSRRAPSGARRRSRPAAWPRSTRSPTTRSPPTPPTGSARRARTPCAS